MINQKLIITDQSYEVSCQDMNFVPCPMRLSCPAEKINLLRENWRVKMFAVARYHAVVCDAFIIYWDRYLVQNIPSVIIHIYSFHLQ